MAGIYANSDGKIERRKCEKRLMTRRKRRRRRKRRKRKRRRKRRRKRTRKRRRWKERYGMKGEEKSIMKMHHFTRNTSMHNFLTSFPFFRSFLWTHHYSMLMKNFAFPFPFFSFLCLRSLYYYCLFIPEYF